MTAIRQDAWTDNDDMLLAEVTLRCIRSGSTQLAAFEEVSQKLANIKRLSNLLKSKGSNEKISYMKLFLAK